MAMMMRGDHGQGHGHDDDNHNHPYFPSQPSNDSDWPIYDLDVAPTLHNNHFDFTNYSSYINTTAFKSQGEELLGERLSMSYVPFTNAQWKELERQAMIYKYMVACIPIPIDLLLPMSPNNTTSTTTSTTHNLGRYTNGKGRDMEVGRCKRTDGKKWRCSREVAPNQKYCDRHMNRGRPRSRKHVEQQQQQQQQNQTCVKKPRHSHSHSHSHNNHSIVTTTTFSSTTLPISNDDDTTIIRHMNNNNNNHQTHLPGVGESSSSTSTIQLPYHHYPYINTNSSSTPLDSRNLEWMIKAEQQQQQQQWLHLMQAKMEITKNPHEHLEAETFLSLNRDCTPTSMFLNQNDNNDVVSDQSARSFIDAWSKTTTTATLDITETTDTGNLSPSSLTLSMGNWVNPNPSPCSWVSPLAEVLRPSSAAVTGDSGSTPVTSPSGVLQKTTMTSVSDSSNCSCSPGFTNPEIALF